MTEPRQRRARPAAELAELARSIAPGCRIEVEPDPKAALDRAWAAAARWSARPDLFSSIGDLLTASSPAVRP